MNKIVLSSLFCASVLGAAPAAMAQCAPGSWLCANVNLNAGASVVVVPRPVPPPVVVYQPPPPVMVVPQPQPVRVYVPQTTTRTYTTTTTILVNTNNTGTVLVEPAAFWRRDRFIGLGVDALGVTTAGNEYPGTGVSSGTLGGGALHLRVRTRPWFAAEFQLGALVGRDYNGDARREIPFTINGILYLNPMSRFQVYMLAGVGFSSAHVEYNTPHGALSNADYGYLGGDAGLGFELWLSPHLAVNADVRGLLRTRVDSGAQNNPEFRRTTASGTEQTTNTSMGLLFQAGATLYF